jgi:hypothetical protein
MSHPFNDHRAPPRVLCDWSFTMETLREIKDASLEPEKPYRGVFVNGRTPTHKDGGPAWNEGLRNATPIQHTDGKMDGKDIGRGKPITY